MPNNRDTAQQALAELASLTATDPSDRVALVGHAITASNLAIADELRAQRVAATAAAYPAVLPGSLRGLETKPEIPPGMETKG